MSRNSVMTVRVPAEVRRGVARLAAQLGHKPAQIGARLIEEGLRRRDFPQIDLRETAAGRVAYLQGTRLAVHWVVDRIGRGMRPDRFATEHDVPAARVYAALAYAKAFPEEIARDMEEAEANRRWVQLQETAWQPRDQGGHRVKGGPKRRR